MSVVIDASFAVELVVSPGAEAIEASARQAAADQLLAPPIFWFELANALRGVMLRRLLMPAERDGAFARVRALDIKLDIATDRMDAVVRASDQYQLTIYDAAYLELAQRTASRLATRDKGLLVAAPRAGVELVA